MGRSSYKNLDVKACTGRTDEAKAASRELPYNLSKPDELAAVILFHLQEEKVLFVTCYIACIQHNRTIS